MPVSGFGKPKYGGSTYVKDIKPKPGEPVIFRILPPLKSGAPEGLWAVYQKVHYGYQGVNKSNPSKPVARPFKCIEERDNTSKMTIVACPECDRIEENKAKLKEKEEKLAKEGMTTEQIEEMTMSLRGWLESHNCDRKWAINVKVPSGEMPVLLLSHKTKKKLDARIAQVLSEDGIDALDPDQGVWFRVTRTGRGIETDDTIDVEYESVKDPATGKISRTIKDAPLTQAEADKALKDCSDLPVRIRSITADQISMLVNGNEDPVEVDEVLGLATREASPSGRTASSPARPPPPAPVQPKAPQVAPEPVQAAALEETEEDEIAAMERQIAAAKAAKQAKLAAAQAPAPSVAPTPAPIDPASPFNENDFLAKYKKKTTGN